MRRIFVVASGVLMAASPSAAQDNPFAFTGGSVKSAYIVYDLRSKEGAVQGATWESGVAPDRWIVRMTLPVDLGGKKDTMRSLVIVTRDSQYKYNTMGLQRGDGEVSPTLRFHLAREYAALDAGGKARFKENLRSGTADNSSASDDMDAFILLTGDKVGSETVAGHKCDVYKRKTFYRLRDASRAHGNAQVVRYKAEHEPGRQKGHPEWSHPDCRQPPAKGSPVEENALRRCRFYPGALDLQEGE